MSTQYKPGDVYRGTFTTSLSTGASGNADGTPTARVLRNLAVDTAVAVAVTNTETGVYGTSFTIPLSYVLGDTVEVLVSATVGGVAMKNVSDWFRLTVPQSGDTYAVVSGWTAFYGTGTVVSAASATSFVVDFTPLTVDAADFASTLCGLSATTRRPAKQVTSATQVSSTRVAITLATPFAAAPAVGATVYCF